MNKNILFTPVGGTDPISMANKREGSIMQICRYYDITDVYLYMSKEMCEYENKDHRYTKAINFISDQKKKKIDIHIIKRENLREVQEFDQFYKDFHECIQKIERDQSDALYFNISSGTPAMKSALLVLQEICDIESKAIQVSTPVKAQNKGVVNGEYDIDRLLLENLDNKPDSENRTKEVKCNNLLKIRNVGYIKEHIKKYNYEAALTIALTMPESSKNYIDYIQLAKYRLRLDTDSMEKILNEKHTENRTVFLPYHESKDNDCIEYILALDINLKNKNYLDFVRGITPIVDRLYILLINNSDYGFSLDDIADFSDFGYRYSQKKLNEFYDKKIIDLICYKNNKKENLDTSFIPSKTLEKITQKLYEDDKKMESTIRILGNFHSQVRNIASHQIKMIDENFIKEKTGQSPQDIMAKIKGLMRDIEDYEKRISWKSYEEMNNFIIKKIDENLSL